MRRLVLIAFLAAAPCIHAQRIVSSSPHFAGRHNPGGHARAFFDPLGFSDPFYSDYVSATGYPVASQPPVIILQAPPAATAPERSSSTNEPLMIELQGDRYVQVSGDEMSGAQMAREQMGPETETEKNKIDPMPEAPRPQQRSSGTAPPAVPTKELPPAILVFRDGHREQVSDYTIADGILYAHSDYFTTGSWNRKIELSSLNLGETLKSNQSQGIRFQLPSAPNEVIVGP
jgi:hypothetical protein